MSGSNLTIPTRTEAEARKDIAFDTMYTALTIILRSHDDTCPGESCQLTGIDIGHYALKLASKAIVKSDAELAGAGGMK